MLVAGVVVVVVSIAGIGIGVHGLKAMRALAIDDVNADASARYFRVAFAVVTAILVTFVIGSAVLARVAHWNYFVVALVGSPVGATAATLAALAINRRYPRRL